MNLSEQNKKIVEIIKNASIEAKLNVYIVGGVVRDLIMGSEIKDIDFLIEGSAIEFVSNAGFKIKSTHEDFNTAKVEIEGIEVDVASTRDEKYPHMGCLPVVQNVGIKIEEDLKRRDFTVNSIAMNIATEEIIDPFLGKEDIKNRTLKILHDKSFIDDPTRILRGLDFKYRFDFNFGDRELGLIKDCTRNYDRTNLSIDRIYLTLNKIFSSKNADKILFDIIDFNIFKIWSDKIGITKEEVPLLEEAALKFKVKEKNKLYLMALENCPYVKPRFKDNFEIYNFFKKFSEVQLAFYYFKTKDESALKFLNLKDIKPQISGKDLLEKGFEQGEIIGVILNSILKEKLLNKDALSSFEEELDFAVKNFKNSHS